MANNSRSVALYLITALYFFELKLIADSSRFGGLKLATIFRVEIDNAIGSSGPKRPGQGGSILSSVTVYSGPATDDGGPSVYDAKFYRDSKVQSSRQVVPWRPETTLKRYGSNSSNAP